MCDVDIGMHDLAAFGYPGPVRVRADMSATAIRATLPSTMQQPAAVARENMRRVLGAAALGFGLSLLGVIVAIGCDEMLGGVHGWQHTTARATTFGVVTSLFVIAFERSTRPTARAAIITSLTTLVLVPITGVLLLQSLSWMKVFQFEVPPPLEHLDSHVIALVLLSAVAGTGLLVMLAQSSRFDRWLQVFAIASVLATGLATSIEFLRIRRPDVDSYVTSLPVIRRLRVGESLALHNGKQLTYRGGRDGSVFLPNCMEGLTPPCETEHAVLGYGEDLKVRHDLLHDLWILGPAFEWEGGVSAAFAFTSDDPRSRRNDLVLSEIAGSVRPAIPWIAGGLIGSVLGVVFLALATCNTRRIASFSQGVAGTLHSDDWVTVGGRAPMQLPKPVMVPPGPILLHIRGGTEFASYRETGAGTVELLHEGTREAAMGELKSNAVRFHVFALMSAVLCGEPLLLFLWATGGR